MHYCREILIMSIFFPIGQMLIHSDCDECWYTQTLTHTVLTNNMMFSVEFMHLSPRTSCCSVWCGLGISVFIFHAVCYQSNRPVMNGCSGADESWKREEKRKASWKERRKRIRGKSREKDSSDVDNGSLGCSKAMSGDSSHQAAC